MRRSWMKSFMLVCLALACTKSQHTPPHYRDDPSAGSALSERAEHFCSTENPGQAMPTRPFLTDGCSSWFDADWNIECCVEHDIRYWCGGTPEQRTAADDALATCIAESTNELVGALMEPGVRVGGHPLWPVPYRWGYGHDYEAGYPDHL
jgi:hypothetical protein